MKFFLSTLLVLTQSCTGTEIPFSPPEEPNTIEKKTEVWLQQKDLFLEEKELNPKHTSIPYEIWEKNNAFPLIEIKMAPMYLDEWQEE